MSIKFEVRNKPKAYIDMIPMIDIVFQLIIFFMVATNFKTTSGMELELPKANYLTNILTTQLNINIVDEKLIYIENVKTDLNGFKTILKNYINKELKEKKSVVIYGNKNIPYQLLIDVMDILRVEGYDSIDLAIKKKE